MKKDSTRDGKLSRTGNVQEVNLMNKSKKVEEPKKKTQIKVSSFMEPISDGEYNKLTVCRYDNGAMSIEDDLGCFLYIYPDQVTVIEHFIKGDVTGHRVAE